MLSLCKVCLCSFMHPSHKIALYVGSLEIPKLATYSVILWEGCFFCQFPFSVCVFHVTLMFSALFYVFRFSCVFPVPCSTPFCQCSETEHDKMLQLCYGVSDIFTRDIVCVSCKINTYLREFQHVWCKIVRENHRQHDENTNTQKKTRRDRKSVV